MNHAAVLFAELHSRVARRHYVDRTLTTQETPAGSEVAIVLDLPSPVVDEESIRLTRDLLSELPGGLVRYFSLSSARIEEISAGAAHDFVGQEATKNRTSGVTVTISEAAAIVSRNESIRDQVIQRECGDSMIEEDADLASTPPLSKH